jgi:hypothetical protein
VRGEIVVADKLCETAPSPRVHGKHRVVVAAEGIYHDVGLLGQSDLVPDGLAIALGTASQRVVAGKSSRFDVLRVAEGQSCYFNSAVKIVVWR